jgi:hypothetical protein
MVEIDQGIDAWGARALSDCDMPEPVPFPDLPQSNADRPESVAN